MFQIHMELVLGGENPSRLKLQLNHPQCGPKVLGTAQDVPGIQTQLSKSFSAFSPIKNDTFDEKSKTTNSSISFSCENPRKHRNQIISLS